MELLIQQIEAAADDDGLVAVTAVAAKGVFDNGVRHEKGTTFLMEKSLVPPHIQGKQVELTRANMPTGEAAPAADAPAAAQAQKAQQAARDKRQRGAKNKSL